ncbi:MAG: hypothetical protein ACREO3_03760, partial [Arenimonas sp.]
MKSFLLFLSGALLGSIAAWFIWLGQMGPAADAPTGPTVASTSVAVTQPPPNGAAPQARPAILREGLDETGPVQMLP